MSYLTASRGSMPVQAEVREAYLDELKEAEGLLRQQTLDLIEEWHKPLLIGDNGQILQGVYFLPGPFAELGLACDAVKEPSPPVKCTCTCGHRHNKKS